MPCKKPIVIQVRIGPQYHWSDLIGTANTDKSEPVSQQLFRFDSPSLAMVTFPYECNILERDVNQQTNKQSKLQMVLMKAAIFSPVGIQDESQYWSVESFSNVLYYAMSMYVHIIVTFSHGVL